MDLWTQLRHHMAQEVEVEEPGQWERLRFHRSPNQGIELVVNRWDRVSFFIILDYLVGSEHGPIAEGRRLAPANPFLAAHIHFLGRHYLYHRLHSVYRPPPRSRAFIIADRWIDELERDRVAIEETDR